MIRQPSTAASLYAWWNAAVADPGTPRHDGLPECGFYRMQHVKGAPYVPVRVFVVREIDDIGELTGPEIIMAEVEGKIRRPENLWLRLTPISRDQYDALVGRVKTNPVMADSMKTINLMKEATGPNERHV
jgi:hypothetical protein